MPKMVKADLPQEDLLKLARVGATADYVKGLKALHRLQRLFPGIDAAAKRQLVIDRMAMARAARKGNGHRRKAG